MNVYIGTRECTSASITVAHQTITCVAPAGVGTGNSIFVTVIGNTGTGSVSYKAPTVVSILAPTEGSTSALITVLANVDDCNYLLFKGTGFGPGPAGSYSVLVSVNGADFTSALWLSQTSISCSISAAATAYDLSKS